MYHFEVLNAIITVVRRSRRKRRKRRRRRRRKRRMRIRRKRNGKGKDVVNKDPERRIASLVGQTFVRQNKRRVWRVDFLWERERLVKLDRFSLHLGMQLPCRCVATCRN